MDRHQRLERAHAHGLEGAGRAFEQGDALRVSVGQDVVLEFRDIQEEAQDEIERYCRMVQGAQHQR